MDVHYFKINSSLTFDLVVVDAFLMAWHHSFKYDFGGFGNCGQLYLLVELHEEVCQSPNRVCFRIDLPWFVHISESVVTTCMN